MSADVSERKRQLMISNGNVTCRDTYTGESVWKVATQMELLKKRSEDESIELMSIWWARAPFIYLLAF
jgi:glutamate synthase domain-containing protein 2